MTNRDPYFDDGVMPTRQTASYGAAVRRQLERWEPLVAKHTEMTLVRHLTPPPEHRVTMALHEYWEMETERHLLLVAIGNLLKAVKLLDNPPTVEGEMARELIQARGLNEHWEENMPVFHVRPRPRAPGRPSGKAFAAQNPREGPYNFFAWRADVGPLVTPHVTATQVHQLVDNAIASVREIRPETADAVPEAAPRPWNVNGDWWPKLPVSLRSQP